MSKITGQVRIVSDGTAPGTRIEVDGKPLNGVKSVVYRIEAPGAFATATLKVEHVAVDVFGRHLGSWTAPKHLLGRTLRSRLSRFRHALGYALRDLLKGT